MGKNIGVAVSGGVDSLYAALKLKKSGYNVTGFHFVTGYEKEFDNYKSGIKGDISVHCLSENTANIDKNIPDAMSYLSNRLDIPVNIIECSSYFKKKVIDYFIHAYSNGLTPNPCLICNKKIKFGLILDYMKKLGMDKIATGHYAKTVKDGDGIFHLHANPDSIKDQSYFLSFLNQNQLSKAIFPLSEMIKDEVKAEVKNFGLSPLSSEESQDICFIKTGNYKEFLSVQPGFQSKPGDIILSDGSIIGQHNGLYSYTIGQRKGINCPGPYPYYVLDINTATNTLTVGHKDLLLKNKFTISSLSWIGRQPESLKNIKTKIRYGSKGADSFVTINNNKTATITFDEPQSAVTPGQGAVFYKNGEVLGGGIIDNFLE